MWKLLSIALLTSSFLYAETTSEKIEDFLSEEFEDNPRIKDLDVEVVDIVDIPKAKSFKAYIVVLNAKVKSGTKTREIKQRMVWFSDGDVITKELVDLSSGISMVDYVKPDFKQEFYTKENLIYGDVNAEHKVAIFSDPLCPFCRMFVPKAIRDMKADPKKFAVYYYHFPLERIHPASPTLVKAAVAAELQGRKNVILDLYKVSVNPRETDQKVILKAFNKTIGTNITLKDLESDAVKKQIKRDAEIAGILMVSGTPTVYLDNKLDKTKKKYQKIK
jgi:protein-disulfide isomerase